MFLKKALEIKGSRAWDQTVLKEGCDICLELFIFIIHLSFNYGNRWIMLKVITLYKRQCGFFFKEFMNKKRINLNIKLSHEDLILGMFKRSN